MLVTLIISLVVIGVLLYLFEILLPIDYRIKQVIYVLIGLYILAWVLAALGVNVPYLSQLLH